MKFKIRNCPDCLWWQSQEFEPKESCYIHESTDCQPPAIVKEIKQKKRLLWTTRFLLGGLALFSFCSAFTSSIIFLNSSLLFSAFCLIILGGMALFYTYLLIELDKLTRDDIKELQKKKAEWNIIISD